MHDTLPSLKSRTGDGPVVIAIPARDEERHIGPCLVAVDAQVGAQADHVVVLVNNSSDRTAKAARRVRMRACTRLHVIERTLAPSQANAGHARRLAMDAAAALAGRWGTLLTTDADGVVDTDWLAGNLAALRAGADAVAGWVELDPADWSRIPMTLHEDDARECAYDALCDEIHARLDPDPADPWPRHTQHSGASIAVTAEAYQGAGGVPALVSGEDRAFFAALRLIDARIRHAPECRVVVSGRIEGRAAGGMADTIRRRLAAPDPYLDDRLEPAETCIRRARMRTWLRRCKRDPTAVAAFAAEAGLGPAFVANMLAMPTFGAAWAAIEATSPTLIRRQVAIRDLPHQMALAETTCARLRAEADPASTRTLSAGA